MVFAIEGYKEREREKNGGIRRMEQKKAEKKKERQRERERRAKKKVNDIGTKDKDMQRINCKT